MRALRWGMGTVGVVLCTLGALALSLQCHLHMQLTKRLVQRVTMNFVNREIRGALHIGHIEQLSFPHIVVRDAAVYDGEGRLIITGERVTLEPDFSKLLTGLVRFRSAHVQGGTLRLIDNGDDEPSLFTTFDSRTPSKDPDSEPPLSVLVDELSVDDVTVSGQVIAVQGVLAQHVHARARMTVHKDADFELRELRAEVVAPYSFVGHIEQVRGHVSSNKLRGTQLDLVGSRGSERAQVQLEFHPKFRQRPPALRLEVQSDHLTPDTLRRVGFSFAEPLSPPLRGQVLLQGPPSDLALSAEVQSEAGNARVSGTIRSQQGVNVRIASQHMDIAKLVPDGLDVRVNGVLDVQVGPKPEDRPRVHAEIARLRYQGLLIPAFELDGTLDDVGLQISRARATQGGRIAVRGRVGFDGHTDVHVDAQLPAVQRDPNLSQLAAELTGALKAKLHVRTPGRDHPARMHIDGDITLSDAQYGPLRAQRVSVRGRAQGDPTKPVLSVDVRASELHALSRRLGEAHFSLQGGPRAYQARGEITARGQKAFSFDAHVAAERERFLVQAEDIAFTAGSASWRGQIRDLRFVPERSLELGLLRLASRAQLLEAYGSLRLSQAEHHVQDDVHAQLQNFDMTALRALFGEDMPLRAGYMDAGFEIRRNKTQSELSLSGALRDGAVGALEHIGALYSISYGNDRLEVDADVDLQDRGHVSLLGNGELDATETDLAAALRAGLYSLSLDIQQLDVRLFPQLLAAAPTSSKPQPSPRTLRNAPQLPQQTGLEDVVQSGQLDGHIEVQGAVASMTLDGQLKARDVSGPSFASLGAWTHFRYFQDQINAQLSIEDARGTLGLMRGSWHVDWRALFQAPMHYLREELRSQDFQVQGETVQRTLAQLPIRVPLTNLADLPLSLASRFQFARKDHVLSGEAQASLSPSLDWGDPNCELGEDFTLTGRAQLANTEAQLEIQSSLDGRQAAAASGKLRWPFERALRGEAPSVSPALELSGTVDLAELSHVPLLCRHGRGKLHADFALQDMGLPAPRLHIGLHADVVPQHIRSNGVGPVRIERCVEDPLQVQAEVDGDAYHADLSTELHGCNAGPLHLNAHVPWVWGATEPIPRGDRTREASLQLSMNDTELAPVLDYLPGVRGFSGRGNGEITARARHGKVDARGQLVLSGGSLYIVGTGQELRDITIALDAQGDTLKLTSLRARTGRGSLQASGAFGLEEYLPRRAQLALVLDNLPVQREGLDVAWLTGSAALIAEIDPERTRTAVKLHTLQVFMPADNARALQTLEPHPDVTFTDVPAKRARSRPYSFEFAIDGRNPATARRNDFEATLTTELDVAYSDPDVHVGGYIAFQRGTFESFGKRFEVNHGSMRFDGGTELNPEVSLVATYDPNRTSTFGQSVVVMVSGTLAKPDVRFYSERCPGEGAVVLLVSGRCPTEGDTSSSTGTSGSASSTQDAFAAGLIGGILTLGVQRELGGLIPRVAVESSAAGTRTRLKAGIEAVPTFMRSLVERVYLQGAVSTAGQTGSTSAGSGTTPDFLLELYFPHNIVGAGKVAPTTRSWGVDVTWEP